MVIKDKQMQTEHRENMRGGEGTVNLLGVVPSEYLPQKCRLFSVVTLEKGCSIGRHMHEDESEFFYVLQGQGVLDDNGTITAFNAGDCSICRSGEFHGIANENDTPLKFVAAIIRD